MLDTFGTQFYPTPDSLLWKMLAGVSVNSDTSILEPSAGKGNIIDHLRKQLGRSRSGGWGRAEDEETEDIDAIEIDPMLQVVLKNKKIRVVHDDFLTYGTLKRYKLIVMNPPFANGDQHLLHALSLLQPGGKCICLLNYETIANPYSNTRKHLLRKLDELGATIERIDDAFLDAERRTGVSVALVKVKLPKGDSGESFLFEEMRKEHEEYMEQHPEETAVVASDYIKGAVAHCKHEQELARRFFTEYTRIIPHLAREFPKPEDDPETWKPDPLFTIDMTINEMVKTIRRKYWKALFYNPKFRSQLTSKLQQELHSRIESLKNYEFSEYNVDTLMREVHQNLYKSVEETIVALFDEFSYQNSYGENSTKIYLFDGWKTNKAWIVGKRIVLPVWGCVDTGWQGEVKIDYKAKDKLRDIERCLGYLDKGIDKESTVDDVINAANAARNLKNLDFKYFTATFYKKGTIHLTFKDDALLKRFNVFGCQRKGWLPPGYGKASYDGLDPTAQDVVRSFEAGKKVADMTPKELTDAEAAYRVVCTRSDILIEDARSMGLLTFEKK